MSGAGAYTSGPLSFMDIYDKMCFTVSSAGGRRGAQMGTFDVGHPDVVDFIRAKRENGRLRQFNLSLLVTREFMEAVKNDADWPLAFPLLEKEAEQDGIDLSDPGHIIWREWPLKDGYVVSEQGLVACKVYKTIRARRLWDLIMASTYDYAEPGFILIDAVNRMNNNWWCETIRATNPCVTADTWVHTSRGPRQVCDLVGRPFLVRVDGRDYLTGSQGFFKTGTKPVVRLQTREGYSLRLTADHRVRRVSRFTRYAVEAEWCPAEKLHPGDRVVLNDHRLESAWGGSYSYEEGFLIGLLIGNGGLKEDAAVLSVWKPARAVNERTCFEAGAVMAEAEAAARKLPQRADFKAWPEIKGGNEFRLSTAAVRDLSVELGIRPGANNITPAMERASSDFQRGFLRGFFDIDGAIQGSRKKGVSVRLAQSDLGRLEAVQRMLLRFGVASHIYRDRRCGADGTLAAGRSGYADDTVKPRHELVISGANLLAFAERIGFADADKQA
ncbi:MAG: LAGLIDADG family homing endonuclease, partial [Phycisphaeraceae bacterium]|nr:LAGLIDADG family homing endonuclease [Phycisphaeraceae bacterium]